MTISNSPACASAGKRVRARLLGDLILLFNATMLAQEQDAGGRQQLGDESFIVSPLFCGSTSLGYASTGNPSRTGAAQPTLTLSWAAALSGSAGQPRVSRSLAALLTVLSARPGSWIEKPRMDGWAAASPRFGDLSATAGFGLDADCGDFVFLNGGAEFESLGVYELIRRRCRFIIAVDASRDSTMSRARLAQLARRAGPTLAFELISTINRFGKAAETNSARRIASPAGSIMMTWTPASRTESLSMSPWRPRATSRLTFRLTSGVGHRVLSSPLSFGGRMNTKNSSAAFTWRTRRTHSLRRGSLPAQ